MNGLIIPISFVGQFLSCDLTRFGSTAGGRGRGQVGLREQARTDFDGQRSESEEEDDLEKMR